MKKRLSKVEDVERTVRDFFEPKLPQFWKKGVADLAVRWHTVVITMVGIV